MEPLRIDQHDQGGWVVLVAVGVVDVATAPALRQTLIEVQRGEGRRVVLDLDGVEFLDSFGLGVIAGALKRAATFGGDVAIVCSRSRLLELFRVTRLDEIVRIDATVERLEAAGDSRPGDSD